MRRAEEGDQREQDMQEKLDMQAVYAGDGEATCKGETCKVLTSFPSHVQVEGEEC